MTDHLTSARPTLLPFRGKRPVVHPSAFLSNAVVIGDVEVGADASLWFGVTVRGDVNEIRIGRGTNIQDGTVIHCTTDKFGTYIGEDVLVGHLALLHGCVVEDGAFIGMKACLMDGVVVEKGAMVAAGALVTPGKRVKSGELWAGSPAKFVRMLTDEEKANLPKAAPHYVQLAQQYLREAGEG
ncbi:gamma carbonic anhydrase family protein [Aerophototrophica crusticola]|uniref:Gamma carbonic anhydrase family protein n=1 Tax=Aerophototrophica crusticola TaxID=1709002 RepID=A0A858R5P8_9PROT|nr:gamma carbonic anhydrase family protein [Rhodospirillaceae bacterium B3]